MKSKTISELYQLKYDKWEKLPSIIGVYNNQAVSEEDSAFVDFTPKFTVSVHKALNSGELKLEDICEITTKLRVDSQKDIGQHVLYYKNKYKQKYFLVIAEKRANACKYMEDNLIAFDFKRSEILYNELQPEIHFLNNIEEAVEQSKKMNRYIKELPNKYFY